MFIPNTNRNLRLVCYSVDPARTTYSRDVLPIVGWYVSEPSQRQKEKFIEFLSSAVPVTFDNPGDRWIIHDKATGRAWQPGVAWYSSLEDAEATVVNGLARVCDDHD